MILVATRTGCVRLKNGTTYLLILLVATRTGCVKSKKESA